MFFPYVYIPFNYLPIYVFIIKRYIQSTNESCANIPHAYSSWLGEQKQISVPFSDTHAKAARTSYISYTII